MVKTTESIPEDTAKVGVGVGVRSGVVGIMLLDTIPNTIDAEEESAITTTLLLLVGCVTVD